MNDEPSISELLETAWTKRREENYEEARKLVDKAHELVESNDFKSLGRIFHVYMQFESDFEHYAKAEQLCKKSLHYYTLSGDTNLIAHSTRHLADLQYELGKEEESEQNYRLAIKLYTDNRGTRMLDLANALRGFGLLLVRLEKMEKAIEVFKETKRLYGRLGLQAGVDEAEQQLRSLF